VASLVLLNPVRIQQGQQTQVLRAGTTILDAVVQALVLGSGRGAMLWPATDPIVASAATALKLRARGQADGYLPDPTVLSIAESMASAAATSATGVANPPLYCFASGVFDPREVLVPGLLNAPAPGVAALLPSAAPGLGLLVALVADASATVTAGGSTLYASMFVLAAATLTNNRTLTLSAAGAVAGAVAVVARFDLGASTLAVANGGPGGGTPYAFGGGKTAATFTFNGTDWALGVAAAILS
jgi:hypothetical protein